MKQLLRSSAWFEQLVLECCSTDRRLFAGQINRLDADVFVMFCLCRLFVVSAWLSCRSPYAALCLNRSVLNRSRNFVHFVERASVFENVGRFVAFEVALEVVGI